VGDFRAAGFRNQAAKRPEGHPRFCWNACGKHFNVPFRLEKYLPLEHIRRVNTGGFGARLSALLNLTAADVPKLVPKWVFAFPDTSVLRSQPAVYRGRVFAGAQDGSLYALDAATGCVYWGTFRALSSYGPWQNTAKVTSRE
jgi:PQQ-like domain